MPFPWKKTRLSRLVADHFHSPKHGGSLVVETGFPTSLVDLFVKNRDRLKNPAKKKKKKKKNNYNNHHRAPIPDPVPPPPSPLQSPPPPSEIVPVEEVSSVPGVSSSQLADPIDCPAAAAASPGVESGDAAVVAVETNTVLLAVVKSFVLVVLALSTKKLAIGITLSAFFLFFLEFLGRRLVRFLDPRSDASLVLKPWVAKVLRLLPIEQGGKLMAGEGVKGLRATTAQRHDCAGLVRGHRFGDQTDEIQVLQYCPKIDEIDQVDEIQPVHGRPSIEGLDQIDEIQYLEGVVGISIGSSRSNKLKKVEIRKGICGEGEGCGGEVSGCGTQKGSHKANFKTKFKKLVPKNFRHLNKRASLGGEVGSHLEGDNAVMLCQERDEDEGNSELVCKDNRPSFSSRDCHGREVSVGAICRSPNRHGVVAPLKEKPMPAKRKVEHLLLCLVVLIGLSGGRIFAIVLTSLWCLMFKLIEAPRRNRKKLTNV